MKKIQLDIYGIAPSQIQGSYSLILAELDGNRKLPIIIGQYEAQAIAVHLEGINTGRPLTHDLFTVFSNEFAIDLTEVFIHQLQEGVFYSILTFKQGETIKTMDSRTSDAIALAIRFDAPIFITESILNEAGIEFENDEIEKPGRDTSHYEPENISEKIENKFIGKSIADLEQMLDDALRNEDYMKAALIRDEIEKRK